MMSNFSSDTEKKGEIADLVAKAFDAACRRLSARMRTEREIREQLRSLGFDDEVTATAVAELKAYGYLDDEKYCKEYFKYAKTKGKADGRILRELADKGIAYDVAQNTIADIRAEYAQEEQFQRELAEDSVIALRLAKKMLRQQLENQKPVDERFLARVGRRLASLGYESGTIYGILGRLRKYEGYRHSKERE